MTDNVVNVTEQENVKLQLSPRIRVPFLTPPQAPGPVPSSGEMGSIPAGY